MSGQRIRIAHVIFRLDYGGLENGVVNIIRGLPAEEFDHTIISLTDSTDFRRRLPDNVPVYEIHKQPGRNPAYLLRVWQMLRDGRYDVLHTRNLPCLESQAAGWLAGVPLRVHGEHGWDVYDLGGSNRRYRRLRRLFRPLVHHYVALSAELEHYLTAAIGVPATRVTRICNGVDVVRFRPAAEAPGGPLVIGGVGRLEAVKNFELLARAFAQLARDGDRDSRLVLVGEGSQRRPITAALAAAGLADRATIAGARDDVPEQMRRFGVFVLPSHAEGISNTILEAMASGLPVIATDVGGNRELVADGETGFLVPPGDVAAMADRLVRYRDDQALRSRHARAARARAEARFSIGAMVAQYRQLYRAGVAGVH
jgi:sugar transferase (PEP-CTERM/EpsH1 system associated)